MRDTNVTIYFKSKSVFLDATPLLSLSLSLSRVSVLLRACLENTNEIKSFGPGPTTQQNLKKKSATNPKLPF